VRIEMRQIGARQEAGRIGGIGPCGRALCCSSWMSNFVSVSTSSARYQDISPNPQKLAGQCAKLKCCMNFEVDTYLEAQKEFPPRDIQLETLDGTYYHFKSDILARTMQYSTAPNMAVNLVTLTVDEVKAIIERNKRGEKVEPFGSGNKGEQGAKTADYENVVGQDDLTRFDKKKKKKNKNRNKEDRQRNANVANNGDTEAQNQQNAVPENPSANSMPNNANGEQAKAQEGNQQNGENGNNNRNRDRNQQKNRQPRNENGNQQNGENNGGQPNGENGGNNNNRNRNQHRRNKNHNNGNRQNNGQQAGGQQNNNGGNQNSNNNGGGSNE